jgi:hypothetical protein
MPYRRGVGRRRYRVLMSEDDTAELLLAQRRREQEERALADRAPVEAETAQHERRADKAAYLREKLHERAESEANLADES